MESSSLHLTMEDESSTLKSHALLLPIPLQGHMNPFMELGKRLAALGVRVTLATPYPHPPAQLMHSHFTLLPILDGLPDPAAHSLMQVMENLEDPVLQLVHKLAAQGCPVTCIVADFALRWSPSLASRACLPEFIFWPLGASLFSIFFHADALIAATEKAASLAPDAMDKIPGLAHLHMIRYADLPFQGSHGKYAARWYEELISHRLKHLPKAHGLLLNSFGALEAEVSRALTVELQHLITDSTSLLRLIGPLTALASDGSGTSLQEEDVEKCLQWLDEQPATSVIFVAFGSLATMSCKEQVQELARGLVASGQRFLWVLRKDAIKLSTNVEDSMTTLKIEDALPHGFLKEIEGMGKVVHWAPQVRVLSHPSIGGFFSHCGWNSILESINAGVPILGWPFLMDQFPNCRLVSHVWRMGLELRRNSLNETTRDDVTNGVRQLMQGPHAQDLHARAIELKKLAQEVVLSSCELLAFVDDIHKLASTSSFKRLGEN